MAEIAALRERIKSVRQTLKITDAMYTISSAKMKKARAQLDEVKPFFEKVTDTIADILVHSIYVRHPYFSTAGADRGSGRSVGLVVITGDKGLAGAYNHNVVALTTSRLAEVPGARIFAVGAMGHHLFAQKGLSTEEDFAYAAQDPTLSRAWDMSRTLMDLFNGGQLSEIDLIYTRMINPIQMEPRFLQLMPLDPEHVKNRRSKDHPESLINMVYTPSVNRVLRRLVPDYLAGLLYGAMVESFCSENNSRMNAMKSASDNATDMIGDLTLQYNQLRQGAITQEITEIVGGAEAQSSR